MKPSLASRSAFLSALAMPRSRSRSAALSRSPLASSSARFTSIMPAPVMARSFLISSVVTAIQVPFRACPRRLLPLPRGLLLVFFALGLVGVGGGARHLRDLGRDLGLGLHHAGGAARGGGSGGVGPFGLLGRGGGFLDGALGAGDRHGQGLGGGGGLRGSLLGRGAVDAAAHLDVHVRQAGGDQLDGADGVVVA